MMSAGRELDEAKECFWSKDWFTASLLAHAKKNMDFTCGPGQVDD